MEANLKFQLPEDKEELQAALDAGKWHSTLWILNQYVCNLLEQENLSEDVVTTLNDILEKIEQLMSEHNIRFD